MSEFLFFPLFTQIAMCNVFTLAGFNCESRTWVLASLSWYRFSDYYNMSFSLWSWYSRASVTFLNIVIATGHQVTLSFPGCLDRYIQADLQPASCLADYSLMSSSRRSEIRREPAKLAKGQPSPWCRIAGMPWVGQRKLEEEVENNSWNPGVAESPCTSAEAISWL